MYCTFIVLLLSGSLRTCILNELSGVNFNVQLKESHFHVTSSMEKSVLEEKFRTVEEKLERLGLDVSQNREEIAKVNVLYLRLVV